MPELLFPLRFQGSIQSPDKFTDNLVRGVRSLLGHSVGGLAGSVSLVTGSLGKALASLSFDKDYKRVSVPNILLIFSYLYHIVYDE